MAKNSLLQPIAAEWCEDSSAVLMCRLENRPTSPNSRGTPFVQAGISSATLYVYDTTVAASPVAVSGFTALSLTVASVIFDTLQGWSVDSVGANFKYTIGPTAFPTGGHRYRVTVKWVFADGTIGHTQWEGPALSVDES